MRADVVIVEFVDIEDMDMVQVDFVAYSADPARAEELPDISARVESAIARFLCVVLRDPFVPSVEYGDSRGCFSTN